MNFRGTPCIEIRVACTAVCAHTYRMLLVLLLPARKVFYYFITERVCQYIAIANKTREKWSIAASTVSWTLDRPVAKYCMKLIHGAAWFIVHARPGRIN